MTIHLARLQLDHELVARLRVRDAYDWHQRIWDAFKDVIPPNPNKGRLPKGTKPEQQPKTPPDFLSRLDRTEDGWCVFIVSTHEPQPPRWCPARCWEPKVIAPEFFQFPRYRFQLLVNPTRKKAKQDSPKVLVPGGGVDRNKSNQRVPITKRAELVEWLREKGAGNEHHEGGGFVVEEDSLQVLPAGRRYFWKEKGGHSAWHHAVDFHGFLRSTDAAKLRETFLHGVGSAKSFGFGLLLLVPVSETESGL